MLLSSVREFKAEVSAEIKAQAATPEAVSFYAATGPATPAGMGLGVGLRDDGEHVLTIRATDPAAAAAMAARVNGEADVRILTVTARRTPAELQGSIRPLEAGAQVQIRGANFVGTLGAFVRDAHGVYALSNSHVLADVGMTPVGTPIGQPSGSTANLIGLLDRFVPISWVRPNLVDAAIARLDDTQALLSWNAAIAGDLFGARAVGADDLGLLVAKIGRTTGVRRGKITSVEIDGLPVGYGNGVGHFDDQIEVEGQAQDFSAAGDSGSLIVDDSGWGVGLLFAGGIDGSGRDFTYANRLDTALRLLGVELEIA